MPQKFKFKFQNKKNDKYGVFSSNQPMVIALDTNVFKSRSVPLNGSKPAKVELRNPDVPSTSYCTCYPPGTPVPEVAPTETQQGVISLGEPHGPIIIPCSEALEVPVSTAQMVGVVND